MLARKKRSLFSLCWCARHREADVLLCLSAVLLLLLRAKFQEHARSLNFFATLAESRSPPCCLLTPSSKVWNILAQRYLFHVWRQVLVFIARDTFVPPPFFSPSWKFDFHLLNVTNCVSWLSTQCAAVELAQAPQHKVARGATPFFSPPVKSSQEILQKLSRMPLLFKTIIVCSMQFFTLWTFYLIRK